MMIHKRVSIKWNNLIRDSEVHFKQVYTLPNVISSC